MLDGPGVRFVAFLAGCPLRCLYCHNPDTACLTDSPLRDADDLLAEIRAQLPFLRRGGGVTISGGEPLVQPEFVKTLLRGAKSLGLHTAIDTTGYLGRRVDDEHLALTDLWLLDVKSFVPETYRAVTGVDLAPTLEFARRLAAAGKKMWLRFVVVPGLTDAPDNIDGVARFAASLGSAVERVEVLPFHKLGEYKWAQLGRPYALGSTPAATPAQAEAARARFRAHGLTAVF
jgi:pyruvate formate lyase activating enzyme